jgi:hypothetical protein
MSSSPTASGPFTRVRVKEAVDYVIGKVFEFTPVDIHLIGNALVILKGKEDDLSIYKSWLELSESQINSLQYNGSNNKLFPLLEQSTYMPPNKPDPILALLLHSNNESASTRQG